MESEAKLEYVIDITIAYPDGGKALEIPDILHGIRPPCDTHLYYRIYPIAEVIEKRFVNYVYATISSN